MKIQRVSLRHFRSVKDATLNCDDLTALVGPNGAGKSCFLKALDIFYDLSPEISIDDFYNRDTSEDIEIEVTFGALSESEKELFSKYLKDKKLTIIRVFPHSKGKDSGRYYGSKSQNPNFAAVRKLKGKELLTAYNGLRAGEYSSLAAARSEGAAREQMDKWENENPGNLELFRDDGQFFGFTNVGGGNLSKFTKYIYIPAVRQANIDAEEGKNSAVTVLMDLIVRKAFSQRAEIVALRNEFDGRYKELVHPGNMPELGELESQLTDTLKTYYTDTALKLNWIDPDAIELPMPKAKVRIADDGFEVAVGKTGHGLQRAFIITMLQHLAIAGDRSQGEEDAAATQVELNIILGIEEPELYQHPGRQRHFAKILNELAYGHIPGVANNTQIIYATHSPLFVGIDRFNQVNRITKSLLEADKPKETVVMQTSLEKVCDAIQHVAEPGDVSYTPEGFAARTHTLMTPWMNEGFFADVVVLVEGETDRAAILGAAKAMNYDLETNGFAVIPCIGKNNLDRPYIIFSEFKIPVYLIWDGDKGCAAGDEADQKKANHRLLKLVDAAVVDWPTTTIADRYACFEKDLESILKAEIGEPLFRSLLDEKKQLYGYQKDKHALKNPTVISELVSAASRAGKACTTLRKIINKLSGLKASNVALMEEQESANDEVAATG